LDVEDVIQGDVGKLFRAREVPTRVQDEFIDPSLGVVSLWALTPFDTRFHPEDAPQELSVSI
jgi:hypothetical protein